MITRTVIEFFIGLIPTFHFPAEIIGALGEAASLIIQINHYIPVDTFVSCALVYFSVWVMCAIISSVLALL